MAKMTLGELKIACMKLIEVQQTAITDDDISDEIRHNVVESINRAIARIVELGKYPRKSVTLLATDGSVGDYDVEYNITTYASDFYLIDKVTYEDEKGIRSENIVRFFKDDSTLVLPSIESGKYIIKYIPTPQQFTYEDANYTEVDLPITIACKIPYFVKAELYEEEQPTLAINSRNIFESYVSTMPMNEDTKPTQQRVKTIISFK